MSILLYQLKDSKAYYEKHKTSSMMYGIDKFNGTTVLECMKSGEYQLVAELECDTLDEAFEMGNIGPEDKIKRHAPMHSVSVGDVLTMDGDENVYVVASFGFDNLGRRLEETAA